MEVRQLRYFLAVVEHGSITRAAEALFISQPSLSQALRAFERQVGARLLRRQGRGVVLTAEGQALVGPARQILTDLADARSAVRQVADLRSGRLNVAASATLALDPTAAIVARLHRSHPGIVVHLHDVENREDIVESVRSGDCELGVVGLPLTGTRLVARPTGTQELLLVLPPGTETSGPVALSSLCTPANPLPLLLPPVGRSERAMIDAAFEAAGARPVVGVECGHLEAVGNMVLAGAGGTFFPPSLAENWRRLGAHVVATRPAPVREIGMVSRSGPLSPAGRAFLTAAGHVP
jgi:DNA-binding transcriptional LysR family regulator